MPNYLFQVNAMNSEGKEVTRQYVSANSTGINALAAARNDGLYPLELRLLSKTDKVLSPFLRLPETVNANIDLIIVEQEWLRNEISAGRIGTV